MIVLCVASHQMPMAAVLRWVFVIKFITSPAPSYSIRYDPSPAWPLCGRLKEAYPDWVDSAGCPSSRFGSSKYSDEPINSPFGPRQLYSESLRYDFHRGIDLSCVTGTPLFATADGTVQKAGFDSSYSDPLVQIRHHRCAP